MATVHLLCGRPGSGKTTFARELEKTHKAVRYTYDEWMVQLYGRSPEQFETLFNRVSNLIWRIAIRNLTRVIHRVVRRLERDGLLIADPEQPWLDLDFHEPLDSVSAASVRYRITIGPHSGNRTLTLHDPSCIKTDKSPKPLTVDRDGFSL